MADVIRVTGLTELIKAFRAADAGLGREVRKTLIETGEVVKASAQSKAGADIRNIGPRWDQMRLGMSGDSVLYIVPARHRTSGTPRPNLAGLLLERAMIPAAAESEELVRHNFENAIDDLNANAGLLSSLHALT
jgi:hypothetical protein